MRRPKLQPHDHRYLAAFNRLSRSRQAGMGGPQPLTLTEIQAYLQIFDVDPARRGRYIDVLQEMDSAYLEHALEKVKAAQGAK